MVIASDTITATLPAFNVTYKIISATVTLDEQWSPYARATLVCAFYPALTDERPDPALYSRCTITLTRTGDSPSSRTLNLVIRDAEMDHKAQTLTLQLSSDEGILQDLGHVATTPDYSGHAELTPSQMIQQRLTLVAAGWTYAESHGLGVLQPFTFPITNQVPNGGMEGTSFLAGAGVTVTRVVRASGGTRLQLSAPTTADGYAFIDGDLGGFRNGMQPGRTYTAAALQMIDVILSGTASTRARRVVVFIQRADGTFIEIASPVPPNTVGSRRVAVTYTIPPDAIGATIRYYHGHTIGNIFWDEASLVESGLDLPFFDGSVVASARYAYLWNGTAQASPSNRIAKINAVAADALIQRPGQSHWDFLEPLMSSIGLRLYCDEARVWRLVDPSYNAIAAIAVITNGIHILEISEVRSALNMETYGALVVRYEWVDSGGISRRAYETAGDPAKKVREIIVRTAPGGGGLAARLLKGAQARKRTFPIRMTSNYSLTPTQKVTLTPPLNAPLTAVISAVTWTFPQIETTVRLRDEQIP